MNITLSPRLQKIADFVPEQHRVIDVGTDHAYIPIWLLKTNRSAFATATDIHAGPLQNADRDAKKYGVRDHLNLLLCDGLSACEPDVAESIIIAGMGGETIISILAATPWALDKRLILQPQSKFRELWQWLADHNMCIADASLVRDAGRIYQVWLVERGEMRNYQIVAPVYLEKYDPLLPDYIEGLIKTYKKQVHGMMQSTQADPDILAQLQNGLNELNTIKNEVSLWQK